MDKATFADAPVHYTVHVDYASLPSMTELEKQFSGKGSVSEIFDGRVWENHESCQEIDETPGEREFLVKHFGVDMTSDAVIAWGQENGYRVATYKEAIEFDAKSPVKHRKFWIAALGSSVLQDDHRFVAGLNDGGLGHILVNRWFENDWSSSNEWSDDYRFLLVRK